jgi:hypothetical protein
MRYFPQLANYIKLYTTLNFLTAQNSLTPTERYWQLQELPVRPQILWKNVLTGKWPGPSPVLMWGHGHAYVFPEGAEHPVWVPSRFVKPPQGG